MYNCFTLPKVVLKVKTNETKIVYIDLYKLVNTESQCGLIYC